MAQETRGPLGILQDCSRGLVKNYTKGKTTGDLSWPFQVHAIKSQLVKLWHQITWRLIHWTKHKRFAMRRSKVWTTNINLIVVQCLCNSSVHASCLTERDFINVLKGIHYLQIGNYHQWRIIVYKIGLTINESKWNLKLLFTKFNSSSYSNGVKSKHVRYLSISSFLFRIWRPRISHSI